MKDVKPLTDQAQSILAILRAVQAPLHTHVIYENPTFRAVRTNPQAMGRAFHTLLQRKLIERVSEKVYKLGPADAKAESLKLGTAAPAPPLEPKREKRRYRKRKLRGDVTAHAVPTHLKPKAWLRDAQGEEVGRSMMVEVRAGSEIALTIGDMRLMVRAVA